MKKINFSELEILDIDWKEIELPFTINKIIANAIYQMTSSLDLVEIAKKINNWEEVELRDTDIEEIKTIINWKEFLYYPVIKRQIIDFIS